MSDIVEEQIKVVTDLLQSTLEYVQGDSLEIKHNPGPGVGPHYNHPHKLGDRMVGGPTVSGKFVDALGKMVNVSAIKMPLTGPGALHPDRPGTTGLDQVELAMLRDSYFGHHTPWLTKPERRKGFASLLAEGLITDEGNGAYKITPLGVEKIKQEDTAIRNQLDKMGLGKPEASLDSGRPQGSENHPVGTGVSELPQGILAHTIGITAALHSGKTPDPDSVRDLSEKLDDMIENDEQLDRESPEWLGLKEIFGAYGFQPGDHSLSTEENLTQDDNHLIDAIVQMDETQVFSGDLFGDDPYDEGYQGLFTRLSDLPVDFTDTQGREGQGTWTGGSDTIDYFTDEKGKERQVRTGASVWAPESLVEIRAIQADLLSKPNPSEADLDQQNLVKVKLQQFGGALRNVVPIDEQIPSPDDLGPVGNALRNGPIPNSSPEEINTWRENMASRYGVSDEEMDLVEADWQRYQSPENLARAKELRDSGGSNPSPVTDTEAQALLEASELQGGGFLPELSGGSVEDIRGTALGEALGSDSVTPDELAAYLDDKGYSTNQIQSMANLIRQPIRDPYTEKIIEPNETVVPGNFPRASISSLFPDAEFHSDGSANDNQMATVDSIVAGVAQEGGRIDSVDIQDGRLAINGVNHGELLDNGDAPNTDVVDEIVAELMDRPYTNLEPLKLAGGLSSLDVQAAGANIENYARGFLGDGVLSDIATFSEEVGSPGYADNFRDARDKIADSATDLGWAGAISRDAEQFNDAVTDIDSHLEDIQDYYDDLLQDNPDDEEVLAFGDRIEAFILSIQQELEVARAAVNDAKAVSRALYLKKHMDGGPHYHPHVGGANGNVIGTAKETGVMLITQEEVERLKKYAEGMSPRAFAAALQRTRVQLRTTGEFHLDPAIKNAIASATTDKEANDLEGAMRAAIAPRWKKRVSLANGPRGRIGVVAKSDTLIDLARIELEVLSEEFALKGDKKQEPAKPAVPAKVKAACESAIGVLQSLADSETTDGKKVVEACKAAIKIIQALSKENNPKPDFPFKS